MKNGRINERNIGSIKKDGGLKKRKQQAENLEIFARVCISGLLKTGEWEHAIDSWTFYDAESLSDFLSQFGDKFGDKMSLNELPGHLIPFSIFKRKDDFEFFTMVKVQS